MNKSELRKIYIAERQKLSPIIVNDLSRKIMHNIFSQDFMIKDSSHIFLPIISKNEINTFLIIEELQNQGKNICIPVVCHNEIENALYHNNLLLKENKWHILEPEVYESFPIEKLEVVFLPLLISDNQGNRVGYGKGFYDRFLSKCNKGCLKIGLNYFDPIDKINDISKEDRKLDYLITPNKIYRYV